MIYHKIVAPLNYIITQKSPCATNKVVQGDFVCCSALYQNMMRKLTLWSRSPGMW